MAAIENPDCSEVQSDMRLRVWKKIDEADGKYLRVILLEDHETIHNAFFASSRISVLRAESA